jgi:hypothetical protein
MFRRFVISALLVAATAGCSTSQPHQGFCDDGPGPIETAAWRAGAFDGGSGACPYPGHPFVLVFSNDAGTWHLEDMETYKIWSCTTSDQASYQCLAEGISNDQVVITFDDVPADTCVCPPDSDICPNLGPLTMAFDVGAAPNDTRTNCYAPTWTGQ